MESYLRLEGLVFPAFSCREARQTLQPIQWGEFRRTVNGNLVHVSLPGAEKYQSIITCADEILPPFHQNGVGKDITVYSLAVLTETHRITADKKMILHREPVTGSVDIDHEIHNIEGKIITLRDVDEGVDIQVSYRPILKAKIISFEYQDHEWDNKVSWTLKVEEI